MEISFLNYRWSRKRIYNNFTFEHFSPQYWQIRRMVLLLFWLVASVFMVLIWLMKNKYKKLLLILVIFSICFPYWSFGQNDEYRQVPGLIGLRTDFSDGAHSLEYLIELADKRGFQVLFINDHDRKVLEYGIRPFQNILKREC